jgi:hypothetical protein
MLPQNSLKQKGYYIAGQEKEQLKRTYKEKINIEVEIQRRVEQELYKRGILV